MSLVGDEGLIANEPLWSRSWYRRPVMVAVHAWTVIVGKIGSENAFASGFDPESLKSFDCLTRAVIGRVSAVLAVRPTVIVTALPFGSESCRRETTLPLLELLPVDDDALDRATFAGNVTSAEPSCDDFAVFLITTFTAE